MSYYANAFRDIIKELEEKGAPIEEQVKEFLKNRNLIKSGETPPEIIKLIVGFVCSRSGRFSYLWKKSREELKNKEVPLEYLKENLNSFLNSVFLTKGKLYKQAQRKIPELDRELRKLNEDLKKKNLESERIELFENRLHKILNKKMGIGPKGTNNILRDCGFFDRIPIDVWERKFLLRSGIFHKYALEKTDPTNYEHLAQALRNFSEAELREASIAGVPLDKNPGIVDLIIFYFCQERTEEFKIAICGTKPKCRECPLEKYKLCLLRSERLEK